MGGPAKLARRVHFWSFAEKGDREEPRFSVDSHQERRVKYFLSAAVSLAVGGACIENGLHPLVLLFLPALVWALCRRDYRRPFFFSERVTGALFAAYVLCVVIGVVMATGHFRLPLFLVYLAFGTVFVRALLPLSDRCVSQLIFLRVGLVLINCILTSHILYALILPFYLFALMGTLVTFHLARAGSAGRGVEEEASGLHRSPASRANLTRYSLIILAVMVVLFPFMPRLFALFPGLRAAMSAKGGFGDLNRQISYRDMTGYGQNRIAFLVRFRQAPPAGPYYWRGRVLEHTDGESWYPNNILEPGGMLVWPNSPNIFTYEIFPYRLQSNRVYVFGIPALALGRRKRPLLITAQGEVVIDTPFLFSDSYTVRAANQPIPARHGIDDKYLSSNGITPKIRALARRWTRGATSRRAKAEAILSNLRAGFQYRLQVPPPPADAHPMEYFLTKSRIGNCTHFAGAAALLMRSVGVPCRIVEGFLGMEKTDVPNEYRVRFSSAHAWVEALLGDDQWTTLDPTPARAQSAPMQLWLRMVDLYDKVEHEWIRLIVNFDRYDQVAILKALRELVFSGTSLRFSRMSNVRVVLPAAGVITILAFIGMVLLRRSRRKQPDASAIYLTTMQKMVEHGALNRVHLWHEENTREIEQRAPQAKELLKRFTDDYLQTRFGDPDRVSPAELAQTGRDLVEGVNLAERTHGLEERS